jgi:hypothetical protein
VCKSSESQIFSLGGSPECSSKEKVAPSLARVYGMVFKLLRKDTYGELEREIR